MHEVRRLHIDENVLRVVQRLHRVQDLQSDVGHGAGIAAQVSGAALEVVAQLLHDEVAHALLLSVASQRHTRREVSVLQRRL